MLRQRTVDTHLSKYAQDHRHGLIVAAVDGRSALARRWSLPAVHGRGGRGRLWILQTAWTCRCSEFLAEVDPNTGYLSEE